MIDSDTSLDFIRNNIKNHKKEPLRLLITWLDNNTKHKILFIIEEILKKYNIYKYNDDASYIIMELISNAVKARYLHIITINTLLYKFPYFSEKIENDSYFNDYDVMSEYSNIFKDDNSKTKLREFINLENQLIKDIDNNIIIDKDKYYDLLSFYNKLKNKITIELIIKWHRNDLYFEVINDAPLTLISRTRIDAKRLTFKEYYDKKLIEKFFIEQLDNTESAGFGLALCDLRLLNQKLDPHEHLKIFDENNKTHSRLILPIKNEFNFVVYHNKY